MLSSYRQPAWIARAIRELLREKNAHFTILLLPSGSTENHAIVRCYRWLDRMLFPPKKDALREEDVQPLVNGMPVYTLPVGKKPHDLPPAPDIVINVSCHRTETLPWKNVRVWGFAQLLQPWYGIRELASREPVLPITLVEEHRGTTHVLYRSYSGVNAFSLCSTLCPAYWKAAHFPARALRHRLHGGMQDMPEKTLPNRQKPATGLLLSLPLILFWRICKKIACLALFKEQWTIAICKKMDGQSLPACNERCTILNPPRHRFWADPFPIEHEGQAYVFFEEWNGALGRGTLVAAPMRKDGTLMETRPVLEGEDHLSYPFVFEWEGTMYLIPETRARRTVELYRAVRFPYEWEHAGVLLHDVEAVDATLAWRDKRWWMFVNIAQEGASTFDELHLFSAETLTGPWHAHPQNPVVSDVRCSRPAGRIFEEGGSLMRPAQDCSVRYGHRIMLNRILELRENAYREETVSILEQTWMPGQLGTHTINMTESWVVADALRHRWRWGA